MQAAGVIPESFCMPSEQPELPQLDMKFNRFDSLPEVALPAGYALYTFPERGMDDWITALNATEQLGEWNEENARRWLEGERHIIQDGTFIIVCNDEPAATACTIPPAPNEQRPEIGWISVSPGHQGKRLGYQVTLAGLRFLHGQGYKETFLHTDDWRLPALKTYLNLGFEPEITHDSHPERWRKIYKAFGIA